MYVWPHSRLPIHLPGKPPVIHSNRRSLKLITLSPLTLALAMVSAQAATRVDLHGQNVALLNSQYKLAAAATGAPSKAKDRHAEILGLDAESDLQVLTSAKDKDGTSHVSLPADLPRRPDLGRAGHRQRRQERQRQEPVRPHGRQPGQRTARRRAGHGEVAGPVDRQERSAGQPRSPRCRSSASPPAR